MYTRGQRPSTKSNESTNDPYSKEEKAALEFLFHYIRTGIFLKPRIVLLVEITAKYVSFLGEKRLQPKDSTKKHLRINLEVEFRNSLHFFTLCNNRVYVRPHNPSTDSIAADFLILLQKKNWNVHEKRETEHLLMKVALILREDIKLSSKEQSWQPQPDELRSDYIELDKASLSRHIEKESVKIDIPTGKRATVMDAMAILQSVHGENLMFDELSQNILKRILTDGHGSERIDVTDV
ncbi:Uncharacterised protein at_DN1324 [Pycnogonum litorale]